MSLKIKLSLLFLLGITLSACDGFIYDDTKDCPQGVYVNFYTQTLCQTDSSYLGEVANLYLLAFDVEGKLAKVITQKDINLSKAYSVLVPLSSGVYSFVGWTGLDSSFDLAQLKPNLTTKTDVMLRLKQDAELLKLLSGRRIFQGESSAVHLPDAKTNGSVYKQTTINLRERTNRIKVEIELHESLKGLANIEDFEVAIRSANGVLNIDGSMPLGGASIQYPYHKLLEEGKLTANFTLLDLRMGYNNHILLKNKESGEVMFNGDLIGSILMKNENVNLDCENDFTVKFVIKDKCLDCYTYFCWAIYVNDWVIHSYETEVGTEY